MPQFLGLTRLLTRLVSCVFSGHLTLEVKASQSTVSKRSTNTQTEDTIFQKNEDIHIIYTHWFSTNDMGRVVDN
jgi:hypothetical protein